MSKRKAGKPGGKFYKKPRLAVGLIVRAFAVLYGLYAVLLLWGSYLASRMRRLVRGRRLVRPPER